jgi:iron-sulfur cluster assembly protein
LVHITVTDAAAKKIANAVQKRSSGIGIRVGVKTTGCSGLAYVLEYVDALNDDDNVIENNGVQVVISNRSLVYLNGMIIDYVRQGLNEGFEFRNPNERDRCGCGESFRI